MRILGIETSCDETAVAVVDDGSRVVAEAVWSSAEVQARYGGVVPEVAAREHVASVIPALETALGATGPPTGIDGVAVTRGPGLLGALLVGVTAAKALALAWDIPVVGVHHLEAHLYANALTEPLRFPALGLVVSGGHTALYRWNGHGLLQKIGETVDDAAGEALDKGARLLGLGYPGGPAIERAGAEISEPRFRLPVPRRAPERPYDFSFSGLKTALSRLAREHPEAHNELARALEEAVVAQLVARTREALQATGLRRLYLAGGVSANRRLRERLGAIAADLGVEVVAPAVRYSTDNGAMVAAAGYHRLAAGERLSLGEGPRPVYPLGE